ncbi:MAG: hypothetical protein M3227_04715 [Thermoproteota archaeon]|nr:hypothetical protein [Thermoproteota archaeon]
MYWVEKLFLSIALATAFAALTASSMPTLSPSILGPIKTPLPAASPTKRIFL